MSASHPPEEMKALGRVPSGLFILTMHQGGSESGMLVSWVQQSSFHPPAISVAVHPDRQLASWLTEGAIFVLNILDDSQTDMIAHFGKGFDAGEDPFANLDVLRQGCAAPVLTEALAYLECQVTARYSPGDHDLIIGQVIGGRVLEEGQPMIHIRKNGMHY